MTSPTPSRALEISCLPRLFGGQPVEIMFEEEYRSLATLGPLTRKALTELCFGKWSSFDVLCTMRDNGMNPSNPVDDRKMASKVIRKDRIQMGVS